MTAIIPGLAAMTLALLLLSELAYDGGGPSGIDARSKQRINASPDPAVQLAELDRLRARLGPLAEVDLKRTRCLIRLGAMAEAAAVLTSYLHRLPVDAEALRLAASMRAHNRTTAELFAAEIEARRRAAMILATVHDNERNHDALLELAEALKPASGDPVPGR